MSECEGGATPIEALRRDVVEDVDLLSVLAVRRVQFSNPSRDRFYIT